MALWLGRRLGDLVYVSLERRRRIALQNLARAFPERPSRERRTLCRRSYEHLGMMAAELCRLGRTQSQATPDVAIDGLEHVDRVMAKYGRGVILTAHLGNWELLCLAPRLTGHRVAIVARALDAAWLNELVMRMREGLGVEIIDKRDALRSVLAVLRRGGLVAVLLDQNASRREGVFVPFFGHLASTSRSVAVLALRTGAPIVPVFIRRERSQHRITIEPPLVPDGDSTSEAAILELTRRCTEIIENAIRRTPDQWLWMHNRWRTRPAP